MRHPLQTLAAVGLAAAAAVGPPAAASPVTFEAVCIDPTADCDGDTGFALEITLDSSAIVPGGASLVHLNPTNSSVIAESVDGRYSFINYPIFGPGAFSYFAASSMPDNPASPHTSA